MALTDNIISYWKLDGNSNDAASSNNGTDTDVTYSAGNGKINSGAGFNNSTSKIVIADAAALKPTGHFTVTFWAKTSDSDAVNYPTVFQSYAQPATVAGIEIMKDAVSQKLRFISGKNTGVTQGTDYQQLLSSGAMNDGNFHFWACVYDATNMIIYKDGSSDNSVSWSTNPAYAATNYVRIGCNNIVGVEQYFFNGAIDEVGFWARDLTSSEITQLYNSNVGLQYPFTTATATPSLTLLRA